MINVVVPIVHNAKSYKKVLSSLVNVDNINVLIGVVSSQMSVLQTLEGDNIYYVEFKDGSNREAIINSLQKYIGDGALLIMRKPILPNELSEFLNTDKDVVVCKRNMSTVKNLFFQLWQKILRLCLGVRLYEGDTSVIYLGEDIATVISGTRNLSYSTRVDRWRGLVHGSVIVQGEPVKTDKDIKLNIKYALIALLAIIIGVVVTVVVSLYARVNIIVGLLLCCLDVICLATALILLVMIIFNNTVGKKNFGYAEEILNDEDDDNIYLDSGDEEEIIVEDSEYEDSEDL